MKHVNWRFNGEKINARMFSATATRTMLSYKPTFWGTYVSSLSWSVSTLTPIIETASLRNVGVSFN